MSVMSLKTSYHGVMVHLSSSGSTKEEDVAGMGVVHGGCPGRGQALLLLWQQSSGFPAFFFTDAMHETRVSRGMRPIGCSCYNVKPIFKKFALLRTQPFYF